MSCGAVRGWLHREAATLSDGERLILEEHLEACDRCRRARDHLMRLRVVAQAMPLDPLPTPAQQRVIASAMLQGARPADPPRPAHSRVWLALPATAVAIAVAIWFARRDDTSEPKREPVAVISENPEEEVAPETAVVSGRVVAAGHEITGELPEGEPLHAPAGATIKLPAAVLVLAPATAIHYSRGDQVVHLAEGRLDVEVPKREGTRLRVATERFIVEVTGTAFQVTTRDVRVTRGMVRVIAPDSTVLAASVSAGESWTFPTDRVTTPAISAATWLERAQRSFKARDCKDAEHYADAVLRATPTRKQTAAASSLLAECAQVSGRLDEAARRYDAIATRFADISAGETALIAAARLEAKRGRASQARALYERYLARYPSGQFVDDARRALRAPE